MGGAVWPNVLSLIIVDLDFLAHQRSYPTLSRVSTEMGNRSWVYCLDIKPSHPGREG